MADKKIAEKWIEKADEDFGYASMSLEDELEFYAQICFHFHQAAEKYLKAYIVKYDLEFKKIHDLLVLLDICSKHDAGFQELREACVFLNRFYMSTRYPVRWESSKALMFANMIASKVKP